MPGLLEWVDPDIEAGGLHRVTQFIFQPRESATANRQ
jgi:hypothetical protein